MSAFEVGDRVRIDIPDQDDPDHDRLHGLTGEIVSILNDDASTETGDPRDAHLYRVKTSEEQIEDLRWRDLRPAGGRS